MNDEICFEVRDGVGRVVLNRPRRINALNRAMIDALSVQLERWANDPGVQEITIAGAGERGFCAGADIKVLRDLIIAGRPEECFGFLAAEYAVDALIANYDKAITSYLTGISMGGGLGIGMHNTRRIGEVGTRMAMPETAIGLWPDVGMCWELSRTPGRVGEYLAMSGESIDGASALWAGLLDECRGADPGTSALAKAAWWIDECFGLEEPTTIIESLTQHPDPQARAAAQTISQRCPMSVAVALRAVRNARHAPDVAMVLAQDLRLAEAITANPADFIEGVRAKMVDKDESPRWRHASLAEVDPAEVIAWVG